MQETPNIVYLLADDMGYGDLSCLNPHSKIKTANLDRLALEGMIFEDAHSSSAVCTPSRYSILTGRYNWRSSLKKGVIGGFTPSLIEEGRMTVASLLKGNGYSTACIGKWHLGMDWQTRDGSSLPDDDPAVCQWGTHTTPDVDYSRPIKNSPVTKGFDYYFGISASLDMPPYAYIENDCVCGIPDRICEEKTGKRFYRRGPIAPGFRHERVTPELTDKACDYIRENAAGKVPFFLYFPLPSPHTPIMPEEFEGKSGTNPYGDFCLMVDDCVGKIMKALKESGIEEDTIVVFTSDNGCSPMADFKELAEFGHNPSYVFRGHKADIFEGGHRIPLIVRWPKKIKPGSRTCQTVCLSDLLATVADITGQKLPDNAGEDSVSNLSVWLGQRREDDPIREATVHHSINGSFSIRQGRWKLEFCPDSGGWSYPIPDKDDISGMPLIQLYDLEADVREATNVQDKHPEIVRKLTGLMTKYLKEGRSTPGARQRNTGPSFWPQLNWMLADDVSE